MTADESRELTHQSALPRGKCPECFRDVALRRGGQLREHRDQGGDLCPASGMTIAAVERAIEESIDEFRRQHRG